MATNGTNGHGNMSLLEGLGQDLNQHIHTLCEYLRSTGLPPPTFDRNTPHIVVPEAAPQDVHVARELLMDYALQIFHLASGPSEYLGNVITGAHYISSLQWLSHFKVFENVPLEGSISYAHLAHKLGVSEARLKTIARMAMTNQIFVEPSPGDIAHSATSAALLTNQAWRDQRMWISEHIAPSIAATTKAHEQWPADTDKNHTPFNAAFNTDLPMYQYLAQNPDLYKLFGRVMKAITQSPKSEMKHLARGFDWAKLGKALVVDVGGNNGHSSVVLAKAFPDLSFVVQDLPHVIEEGRTTVESQNDAEIAQRIAFRPHDFFAEQTIQGADIYLLRQIFHNWDFENCVKILKALVPAMKKDSHIIIMDFVLPKPGAVPAVSERVLRSRDMGMMQLFNSLERDLEEWNSIFSAVDSRLKLNNVDQPWGSSMSVLDLVLSES